MYISILVSLAIHTATADVFIFKVIYESPFFVENVLMTQFFPILRLVYEKSFSKSLILQLTKRNQQLTD